MDEGSSGSGEQPGWTTVSNKRAKRAHGDRSADNSDEEGPAPTPAPQAPSAPATKVPKMKPLFVFLDAGHQYPRVYHALKSALAEKFVCQNRGRDELMVHTANITEYHRAIKALQVIGAQHSVLLQREETPQKFVLRGVHRHTPNDSLQQEFAAANLPVQNFWFLENRQKREKCDVLVIEVPQTYDAEKIRALTEFAGMPIRVDDYHRPSGPSQCSVCQRFNHVGTHCQQQHCANYKGCSAYKKESRRHLPPQVRKAREQQSRRDIRENRPAATQPAPQQQPPPGFFGPPGPQPWGPPRHHPPPGFTQFTNNRFEALTHHGVPSYNELDFPVVANNPWQRRPRQKQPTKNWTDHKKGNGKQQQKQQHQQPTPAAPAAPAAPAKEKPAAAPRRVTPPAAAQTMVVDTAPVSPPPPPSPATDTQPANHSCLRRPRPDPNYVDAEHDVRGRSEPVRILPGSRLQQDANSARRGCALCRREPRGVQAGHWATSGHERRGVTAGRRGSVISALGGGDGAAQGAMKKTRRARSERSGRGRGEGGGGGGGASRDSSVSSSEVRCACQYFQSSSLLPERTALVMAGRPSSRAAMGDHEYEPISPPPDARMEAEAELRRRRSSSEVGGSSIDSRERRFLHAPLPDMVAIPGDGELEDEAMAGRELGDTNNGDDDEDEHQQPERFLNETPTTTESRTDGEFNTSNVDSSALEDLPLHKDARREKQQEEELQKSQPANLQQKIRSQAGKLRTCLRNIKKPKFTMPERPKITLPERPKFNLPDRPKFTMPERPKFSLPQRPKFSLPERPKFTMPERPKISMPSLSSFSSKAKGRSVFSSTRRPLRERSANVSTVSTTSSKKKRFDFDFRTYPRLFDRKARSKPNGRRAETPPPPTTPFRKKGPVGHRWLHRFKDIIYADEDGGPPTSSEGTRVMFVSQDSGEPMDSEEYVWEEREKKGLNEDVENVVMQSQDSGHTESISKFKDKDVGVSFEGELGGVHQQEASSGSLHESEQEQQSSGSSSERHRAGVLEEIDSDEFFLRQKGISQEDVVLGHMLTSEIRDAFRSADNGLKQMDSCEYDDDNQVDNLANQYFGTPERETTRPDHPRSLKPRKISNKSKESSRTEEPFYNTFPPIRPKRSRHTQNQSGMGEGELGRVTNKGNEEEKKEVQDTEISLEEVPQEFVKLVSRGYSEETEAIFRVKVTEDNVEDQDVELQEIEVSQEHPEIVITDAHDDDELEQQLAEEKQADQQFQQWQSEKEFVSQTMPPVTPPTAPKRKKRNLKQTLHDSPFNANHTKEDWMKSDSGHIAPDEIIALHMESDYIIPDASDEEQLEVPPVAPKRTRRKSKSSYGASLMEDEDRTSHGASSLPAEEGPPQFDFVDFAGYASVVKPVPIKPERPKKAKPLRPPPPGRRKKTNGSKLTHFFSLPRKIPPHRPVRNYSTVGPSRPPRQERFSEFSYIEQYGQSEPYIKIEGGDADQTCQEESFDSNRDLQSGVVIEKMKGRPLPPPPRPPRKNKEGRDTTSQFDEEEALEPPDTREDLENMALAALKDNVLFSQKGSIDSLQYNKIEVERAKETSKAYQTSVEPEEVTVSTQTDPTMEDYSEDLVEEKRSYEQVQASTEEIPEKLLDTLEKPDVMLFHTKEVSTLSPDSWRQDEEIIESAVLGRLVCRSETSPESTLIEPEGNKPRSVPKSRTPSREKRSETVKEPHHSVHVSPDENTEVELLHAQRLHVSELDVDRLNVGELQAQKILVSDIDGVSMQVAELTSKSGNLVVSGLELPPGFMQELCDARTTTPTHIIMECSSTQTSAPPDESKPAGVPPSTDENETQERTHAFPAQQPPATDGNLTAQMQANAFPPTAAQSYGFTLPAQGLHPAPGMHFVSLGSYVPGPEVYQEYVPPVPPPPRVSSRARAPVLESEDEAPPPARRRRHHAKPLSRYSSDEEEHVPFGRRHGPRPADTSVSELVRCLLQQLESLPAGRWLRRAWQAVCPRTEERRHDLQTALCVLLVGVALLILLGFGSGKTFHHHHWDYYFPPPL
ncbi:uncharacterized protein LOC134534396 [Bacillus rossius redtenbacheri]|uniref:uncharacterized protein LOC134534396 n=1 Tax=Bacillus rossius redtenbacheri TaxID=93214 RepID=UPI002FDEB51E